MATVRELITKIGFKIDETNLLRAERSISSFKSAAIGIAAEIGALGGSLFALVKTSAHLGEEMDNNATKLGVSTTEFQKMSFAAEQAGVSQETLIGSLGILSVHLQKAREGSKEALTLFSQVGINAAQIKGFKSSTELFKTLADRLNDIKDPLKKGALTKELLGRGGLLDLPLIKEGTKGIEEAGEALAKMGGILDEDTIKQGHKFNDQLEALARVMEIFKTRVGAALFEPLSKLVDEFFKWLQVSENQRAIQQTLHEIIEALTGAFKGIFFVVNMTWKAFKALSDVLGGLGPTLEILLGLWTAYNALNLASGIYNLVLAFSFLSGPMVAIIALFAAAIYYGKMFYDTMIGRHTALTDLLNSWGPNVLKNFRSVLRSIMQFTDQTINSILHPFQTFLDMLDLVTEKLNLKPLGISVPSLIGAGTSNNNSRLSSSSGLGFIGGLANTQSNVHNNQQYNITLNGVSDGDVPAKVVDKIKEHHDKEKNATLLAIQPGTNVRGR